VLGFATNYLLYLLLGIDSAGINSPTLNQTHINCPMLNQIYHKFGHLLI